MVVLDEYIYDTQVYYNVSTMSTLHLPVLTVLFSTLLSTPQRVTSITANVTYNEETTLFTVSTHDSRPKQKVTLGPYASTYERTTRLFTVPTYASKPRQKFTRPPYTLPAWYLSSTVKKKAEQMVGSRMTTFKEMKTTTAIYDKWIEMEENTQLELKRQNGEAKNMEYPNPFDFLIVYPVTAKTDVTENFSASILPDLHTESESTNSMIYISLFCTLSVMIVCFTAYFGLQLKRWYRKREQKREQNRLDSTVFYQRARVVPEMCECIFLNCPAGAECEKEKLLAKKVFADPNIPLDFTTFKPKKNVQFSDQNTSTDDDITTALIHQSKGSENV